MYQSQRSDFSLGTYAYHVLAAGTVVVTAFVGYWLLLPKKLVSSERLHELGGTLIGILVLTAIATVLPSYLLQKGYRKLGTAIVAVALALLVLPVVSLYRARNTMPPAGPGAGPNDRPYATLPDDESVPLETVEESGVRKLRHPKLGFSVLHPGADYFEQHVAAFEADTKLSQIAGGRNWTKSYVFSKKAGGAALGITIANGVGRTEQELQKLASEVEEDFVFATRAQQGGDVKVEHLRNEVMWNDRYREATRGFHIANLHCTIKAHAFHPANHPPYVVLLMASSQDPAELDGVLASFSQPTGG
jgi:hypothetical protein